ncbi:NUDIX domain-containing protein [Microbacterium sp. Re1]|uniref:NUDIX domain-containing protein n=1 Tax=Microbacterium commune TaxID=2762219 RepID=A0ABR8W7U1_9MICO|nr:NUDIX hydrolase [Microbacterium commune]MBD8012881.1 NUDIX domain-containing protein [Microbacterium commune]
MTIVPPAPDEPRRPLGPQNAGDAWVVAPTGEKYWGRFGAAGVLAVDPERGVLLQHRVGWSHFGGTWGIPGGALHEGESALDGALREAQEEAGIPDGALHARFARVLDLQIWSYTTVVADVLAPFDPVISDPESLALDWVPVEEVDRRPLHPGFAASWPLLRSLLSVHPAIVVDAANVAGSVPDGWWKDRAGAATRLHERLSSWAADGVDAGSLGLEADRWFPPVSMVVEGAARAIPDARHQAHGARVAIVRAAGAGDDAIVEEARRLVADGSEVIAVTSDRGLAVRLDETRARVESAGWLLRQMDARG